MAINWREHVNKALEEIIASGKLPPMIGGGRRTIVIPEPKPEDERPLYKTEGEVPEGYTRAEVCRPNRMDGDKVERLGDFWAHVKHQGQPQSPAAERVFTGDIVDIPNDEFETLYARNWVRTPWTKPSQKQSPAPTKQQAA